MLYVITGGTGNTGKPLAEALLAAGKKVRVISRDAEKAKGLAALGAEIVVGNTTDAAVLNKAFEGAHAVYFMIPPDPSQSDFRAYQKEVAEAGAAAIRANKVPNVVTLSSIGAHLTEGAGVVQGLHVMETLFNGLEGTNVLHLRPGYFMENLLGQVGGIKHQGAMGAAVPADKEIAMIATADIAAYAAQRLLALDFKGTGNFQHLVGPRAFSYSEAAKVLGAAIGKPDLAFYPVSVQDFKAFMIQGWGATESFADQMIEFTQALNAGKIEELATKDTLHTATTLEQFSGVFKYVYSLN
jgi:uncharacterized protein YbjT (DUF2867 family)